MTQTQKEVNATFDKASTSRILGYLVYRHRVFLLICSNVLTLTYIVVTQAPMAVNNIIK